jgi:hypothetical protein
VVELWLPMGFETRPPGAAGRGRHWELAELAARQHGVVSIGQLYELGYSKGAVGKAVASGRLHPLQRSVYAVGHRNLSLHGQCLAAVLTCGPEAVLSHFSAAWLWGLARWPPAPFHVTGPIPRGPRQPVVIHRTRRLDEADRSIIENIPVNSVPRLLLDMAARVRSDTLAGLLERSEELKLFDLGAVNELLDRTRGHHGWGRLRRAIAIYEPPPFSRSKFERRFLRAVAKAGLPRPVTGFNVAGHELDVYWPEARFAVELDVYETHGTRAAFERDHRRDEDLALAGVEVRRVTAMRFEREPDEVIGRIAELLARRLPSRA